MLCYCGNPPSYTALLVPGQRLVQGRIVVCVAHAHEADNNGWFRPGSVRRIIENRGPK